MIKMDEKNLLNETVIYLLENFGMLGSVQAKKESEVKIFDIDASSLTTKLDSLGAKCTFNGERQVSVYDSKDKKIINSNQLLRLTISDSTKLTLHINQNDYDNKRVVKVSKMPNTETDSLIAKLNSLDFFPITDVKSERIAFELPGINKAKMIELNIDIFPEIPPFLEIDLETLEGSGYTLDSLLKTLDLSNNKKGYMGTEDIHSTYGKDYFKVYSVNKDK